MLSRILVFVGGLLVVALFAALIAPLFIDWTDFRKDFEREASRIMGKPVVVHGSVDARLMPFPSVTLNDVRVGQSESGEPLIQVEHFSMDAELAPFLSGEALIFDMRLEQPKAKVRLLPDGTLDWVRGTQGGNSGKDRRPRKRCGHRRRDRIHRRADRAGPGGSPGSKPNFGPSLAGPWKMEGDAALDGERAASPSPAARPDDEAGTLAHARAADAGQAPVRRGTRRRAEDRRLQAELPGQVHADRKQARRGAAGADQSGALRVTGGFELTNERIRVPEYRLEIGPKDDPYLVTGEATLDTGKEQEFLLRPTASRSTSAASAITARRARPAATRRFRCASGLTAMMAIAAGIPIPQVPGRASLKLPAIVDRRYDGARRPRLT